MSIPLAILLVACFAAGANAAELPGSFTSADLKSLENFLRANSAHAGGEADLALIEFDFDTLNDGAKRAARAILALKGVKECNEDALSALVQIEAFRKNHGDYGMLCREVVQPLGENISKFCKKHVEKTAAERKDQLASDDKVAKLLKVLSGAHRTVGYSMTTSPSEVIFYGNFFKKFLDEGSAPIAGNKANFDTFLDSHIVEPCKRITASLGDSYKQAWAVANHQHNWMVFHEYTSVAFKNILWAYESCEKLLSMDDQMKTRMFQEMR